MLLSELFERAEARIARQGWWDGKGDFPTGDNNVCMMLAIGKEIREEHPAEKTTLVIRYSPEGVRLLANARRVLHDLIGVPETPVNSSSLARWNDTHSEAEVRRLLLEAAAATSEQTMGHSEPNSISSAPSSQQANSNPAPKVVPPAEEVLV